MFRKSFFTAFALMLLAAPAFAVDLEKIDHAIRKEPAYQTRTPKYCLVVLGPNAEAKVWLVLDGDVLYVDRNGNGDLTEEGEKLKIATPNQDPAQFNDVEIAVGQVKAKLSANAWGWLKFKEDPTAKLEVSVDCTLEDGTRFVAWGDERSPLNFASKPSEAPIVHFGGPLVMGLEIRQPLVRKSATEFELNMAVGCKGRGPGSFAAMTYTPVPKDAYPKVVFEFPGPVADQPIKAELIVKDRCRGVRFHDTVRVESEPCPGKVRVTISFENWKGAKVAPGTFELDVPLKPAKKAQKSND